MGVQLSCRLPYASTSVRRRRGACCCCYLVNCPFIVVLLILAKSRIPFCIFSALSLCLWSAHSPPIVTSILLVAHRNPYNYLSIDSVPFGWRGNRTHSRQPVRQNATDILYSTREREKKRGEELLSSFSAPLLSTGWYEATVFSPSLSLLSLPRLDLSYIENAGRATPTSVHTHADTGVFSFCTVLLRCV